MTRLEFERLRYGGNRHSARCPGARTVTPQKGTNLSAELYPGDKSVTQPRGKTRYRGTSLMVERPAACSAIGRVPQVVILRWEHHEALSAGKRLRSNPEL